MHIPSFLPFLVFSFLYQFVWMTLAFFLQEFSSSPKFRVTNICEILPIHACLLRLHLLEIYNLLEKDTFKLMLHGTTFNNLQCNNIKIHNKNALWSWNLFINLIPEEFWFWSWQMLWCEILLTFPKILLHEFLSNVFSCTTAFIRIN